MLYTIGHSNQTANDLINKLVQHKIEVVYDVRSVPYSKYTPQFNRQSIEKEIRSAGIDYKWRKDLGGLDDNIPNEVYQKALSEVVEESERKNVVVMCSEGDYKKCHRWSKIAKSVIEIGKPVFHIIPSGGLVKQEGFQDELF